MKTGRNTRSATNFFGSNLFERFDLGRVLLVATLTVWMLGTVSAGSGTIDGFEDGNTDGWSIEGAETSFSTTNDAAEGSYGALLSTNLNGNCCEQVYASHSLTMDSVGSSAGSNVSGYWKPNQGSDPKNHDTGIKLFDGGDLIPRLENGFPVGRVSTIKSSALYSCSEIDGGGIRAPR